MLGLFSLPFILVFLPSFVLLASAGEFYSTRYIETFAENPHLLVGMAYSYYRAEYQLDETLARHPLVISLGNSRAGQFRSEFFADPSVFYNTTEAAPYLSNMVDFLNELPNPPRIIIADMDHYYFEPGDGYYSPYDQSDTFLPHSATLDPFVESYFRNGGWWEAYLDYASGKYTLADVFGPHATTTFGLRALATGDGFLSDGSDYRGYEYSHEAATEAAVQAAIQTEASGVSATYGDKYGSTIPQGALDELRTFLSRAQQEHVFVIGYLPPIPHAIYEAVKDHPDAPYAYGFRNLAPTLASIYHQYGFDFYDFSDPNSFGSSDQEMVDQDHGSEKMYLRLFIIMAEKSKPLGALVNVPSLEKSLAAATSSYVVFDPFTH